MGAASDGKEKKLEELEKTLVSAENGQAIVLPDVLLLFRHHCGASKDSCAGFLAAVPAVADALKKGPGTWDRKVLNKKNVKEFDDLLVGVKDMPEAADLGKSLLGIAKELRDMSPKSMKGNATHASAITALQAYAEKKADEPAE